MTVEYTFLIGRKGLVRFKHIVESAGINFGIDDYLRWIRRTLHPAYRREYIDTQNIRLLLALTLKEDANCIDVGAYRGAELAEIVRVAPQGKHIAYEPLPLMHKYLTDHFPTVDVRWAALSNEVGERSFAYLKYMPGYSGFSERSYAKRSQVEKITVRTETLDSSLPSGYVPDLIKIDVEGAEGLVIEGAINTISEHQPIVIFEHGKGGADYYNIQSRHIYELLNGQAGLRIFDLDGNGPYNLSQFEESYARNNRWNYVACR
jgi:FkbM family methyltransferase